MDNISDAMNGNYERMANAHHPTSSVSFHVTKNLEMVAGGRVELDGVSAANASNFTAAPWEVPAY